MNENIQKKIDRINREMAIMSGDIAEIEKVVEKYARLNKETAAAMNQKNTAAPEPAPKLTISDAELSRRPFAVVDEIIRENLDLKTKLKIKIEKLKEKVAEIAPMSETLMECDKVLAKWLKDFNIGSVVEIQDLRWKIWAVIKE